MAPAVGQLAGLAGFLGKNHSVSQLADALRKIVRGQHTRQMAREMGIADPLHSA